MHGVLQSAITLWQFQRQSLFTQEPGEPRVAHSQGGRKGHAALLRSEAQLQLLMRMASAGSSVGQHQAAAQRLVATNAIARLSQVCATHDAMP